MVVDPSHIQHLHQMIFQDFHRLEIAKSDYLLLSALLERFFQWCYKNDCDFWSVIPHTHGTNSILWYWSTNILIYNRLVCIMPSKLNQKFSTTMTYYIKMAQVDISNSRIFGRSFYGLIIIRFTNCLSSLTDNS